MTKSIPALLALFAFIGSSATAQTVRSARDTASAYGARLTTPGDPTKPLNARRIHNRIENRINNRISFRIERYRLGSAADPLTAAREEMPAATQAFTNASNEVRQGDLRPAAAAQRPGQSSSADDSDPR